MIDKCDSTDVTGAMISISQGRSAFADDNADLWLIREPESSPYLLSHRK